VGWRCVGRALGSCGLTVSIRAGSRAVALGSTGITVSKLCFGTLTASPLQLGLAADDAAELMLAAWRAGVRFFDTAKLYDNYDHLCALLRLVPRESVVVATKSYAYDDDAMRADVLDALRQLDTDYIDIFLLHEQESALTLRGHRPALLALADLKRQGIIRAIGLSTHTVAGARAGAFEPLIDVIHAPVNRSGLGIVDGDLPAMLEALCQASRMGKGIYAMKPLGGGHLGGRAQESLAFVRDIPYIHAVALGLGTDQELAFAVEIMAGREPPAALGRGLALVRRQVTVDPWCDGCGSCADACPQGAISLEQGRACVCHASCVRCGYCAAACPGFHIKVVQSIR